MIALTDAWIVVLDKHRDGGEKVRGDRYWHVTLVSAVRADKQEADAVAASLQDWNIAKVEVVRAVRDGHSWREVPADVG